MSRKAPRIFISACEPSGDLLGAELMTALDKKYPERLEIVGIGGHAMAARGLHSLVPTGDLAVMGFGEVLPVLRKSLALARRAAEAVDQAKPDILVTIDSMGFHKQMVSRIRKRNPAIRTVHYGAPKYWAWWPGRARRIQGLFDEILALFPFEPAFFAQYDLPCQFVGHPAVNRMNCDASEKRHLKKRLGVTDEASVVVFLPGSRPAEVKRLMPVFAETLKILQQSIAGLIVLLPTTPIVSTQVRAATHDWGAECHVLEGEVEKTAAFQIGQIALTASGTVSLELAACGLPQITAYKIGPASALIARKLIRIEHVNPVNILAEKPIIPEFLQQDCRPEMLSQSILELLSNPDMRDQQRDTYLKVLADLGFGGTPPPERAADAIIQHFPGSGL